MAVGQGSHEPEIVELTLGTAAQIAGLADVKRFELVAETPSENVDTDSFRNFAGA
jgi:hypothetical protein